MKMGGLVRPATAIPTALVAPKLCPRRPISLPRPPLRLAHAPTTARRLRTAASGVGATNSFDDGDTPLPEGEDLYLSDDDDLPLDQIDEDLGSEEMELIMGAKGVTSPAAYFGQEEDDDSEDEDFEEEAAAAPAMPRKSASFSEESMGLSLDALVAEVQRSAGPSAPLSASDSEGEEPGAPQPGELQPGELQPPPQRHRNLRELLRAAGYPEAAAAAPDVEISNIISCNSQSATEGSLYICVPDDEYPEQDGHDFADDAVGLGAVVVLAEYPIEDCLAPVVVVDDTDKALKAIADEFYDHPFERVTTVAFIGSYGKTTCCWLARGLLEEAGQVVGMIGNSEYTVGEVRLTPDGDEWVPEEPDTTAGRAHTAPFSLADYGGRYELPPTTPNALNLRKTMAGIADRGATTVLLEIDPMAAADGRVEGLRPDVLVFTNVDPDVAAQDPEGREAYEERVAAMFEGLDESQKAIINIDSPFGELLRREVEASEALLITYAFEDKPKEKAKDKDAQSEKKGPDIFAEKFKPNIWEFELLVNTPVGRLEMIIRMMGRFNVLNVLAAVGVGLATGVPLVPIVGGIESVEIVPGRSEIIEEVASDEELLKIYPKSSIPRQNFAVIVDAAKTPQQLARLLDEVSEAGARRILLVMGCPWGTSPEHRAAMGRTAHDKAQIVFFTNEAPGLEKPQEIIAEIVKGLPEDVVGRHAGAFYPWLQDSKRTPQWFEPWILRYQSEVGRYIIEDRFSAIRVAIGTAKPRDVVVVVGRGDLEKMEVWDGIPAPRSEEERRETQEAADRAGQWLYGRVGEEETEEWKANDIGLKLDEYWGEKIARGDPVERETIFGWFDDRKECREALIDWQTVLERPELKDVDRSMLPWTRYPEERLTSMHAQAMKDAASSLAGSDVDQYLRVRGREIQDLKAGQGVDDEGEEYEYEDNRGGGAATMVSAREGVDEEEEDDEDEEEDFGDEDDGLF